MKSKVRVQLEQLQVLREAGYEVPDALLHLVERADQERRGVAQLWQCACGKRYESLVRIREYRCSPKCKPGEKLWEVERTLNSALL